MACQIVKTKGAVFSVWGKPEVADMDQLLSAVESAARETGGPVVYVTRVPAGSPAPEGAAKQRLDQLFPRLLAHCSSYHVVIEGEGFVAAFKRGVLTNLLQPFWRKRMFFVHARCSDIKNKLLPHEKQAVETVLYLAEDNGLVAGSLLPHQHASLKTRYT